MWPAFKGSDMIVWGIASRGSPCLIGQGRRGLRALADDLLHVPPHEVPRAHPHVLAPVPVLVLGGSNLGHDLDGAGLGILINSQASFDELPCPVNNLSTHLHLQGLSSGQGDLLHLDIRGRLPSPFASDFHPLLHVNDRPMDNPWSFELVRFRAVRVENNLLVLQPLLSDCFPCAFGDWTRARSTRLGRPWIFS